MSASWRRVIVKVGSSSITDASGRIEPAKMWAIARGAQVLSARLGARVVLVSSGAGAAGRERLGLNLPLTLPHKQAAAAVGQALLMLDWARAFAPLPVAQLLLTAGDIQDRRRYVNARNALESSLALGAVPVVNENDSVATSEIRFGDNDTLSAWTAYLVGADALLILTDVGGLFDADPRQHPGAKRIPVVRDLAAVRHLAGGVGSARGTGGMATKLAAAALASEAGIETVILSGGGEGLEALARGEDVGTRFLARARTRARKAWLAQQPARGRVVIDEGAARALARGRSLLPSGVVAVEGDFDFGDAVDVLINDPARGRDARRLGRGLTNYAAGELERIRGLKTGDIAAVLGSKDFDEVIHRDNLALVGTPAPVNEEGDSPQRAR